MSYQLSTNTFFVDRTIFTNIYPDLKGNRLRVYLLMCRVTGAKQNGACFMGINTIAKEINLTEYHTRSAIDWLCNNYFIQKVKRPYQSNLYRVLVTPDYDHVKKKYHSNESITRTRFNMKDSLNAYVELPIEVMKGSILRDKSMWSDRKIKVLGQLYLYHWIDENGGVDPQAVHLDNNSMYISDLLSDTLGCSKNDIERSVRWLLKEGFATEAKVVYRINNNSIYKENQYVGDVNKINLLPTDKVIKIIRMNIIPSLKLQNAIARTGGKIAQ
ncbi:hypothetical protein M3E13_04305 [Oceanobacillus kimchii]|uniref:hypothetical protein n=1 Tax=Oceanobacillus kimchii TaxID=746691 RepID=UPI0021A5D03F|nr:hypothetical protein [Oceanobacillus kimchii]MCT1577064.1 hypothetical protein [Oceanobacillus kimchii]MCT2135134.1 hypothetical protein [Oceanobacillus kimchii]